MKCSKREALLNTEIGRMTEKLEHLKASVRAKVEHPFHVVKNLFRHRKARYRALAKTRPNCLRYLGSPTYCWPADDFTSLKPELRLEEASRWKIS